MITRFQIFESSLPKIIHQLTFQGEFPFFQVWKYTVSCNIWLRYASQFRHNYKLICLWACSSYIAHTNYHYNYIWRRENTATNYLTDSISLHANEKWFTTRLFKQYILTSALVSECHKIYEDPTFKF